MLTFVAIIAIVGLLVASAALLKARSAGRRAERLAESYWELRYETGQLKARLNKLESLGGPVADDPEPAAKQPATTSFIPLASLKK